MSRGHKQGHCIAHQVPFGALIYFAPTPRTGEPHKPPFQGENILGLLLGYEFHPGGLFAGRYRVLEWEQLRIQPQLVPRRSAIQFVDTVFPSTQKDWYFPLGVLAKRRAEGLTDEIWNATLDELRVKMGAIGPEGGVRSSDLAPEDMNPDAPRRPLQEEPFIRADEIAHVVPRGLVLQLLLPRGVPHGGGGGGE